MFIKKVKQLVDLLYRDRRGNILLVVMIFGTISLTIIVVGLTGYAVSENSASNRRHNSEMALQIADAGLNYYRWHLAHDKTDYYDGNGENAPGPYVHDYEDKDGNVIGQFSLDITPPSPGSSVVLIESTGWLTEQPTSRVKIKARVGFSSLTDYAFLTATDAWISDSETIHGKFHANGGIRFDGVGDAPITSAVATYICKESQGCGNDEKEGIWGNGGPTQYWNYPVPAKDFSAVTASLADIEDQSDPAEGGINFSSSGQQGWRLQFTSGGQFVAYRVLTTKCFKAKDVGSNDWFWPCVDALTFGSGTTYDIPSNGIIFVDDNVWVDGVVNGRVTIGTSVGKSIIINGDITYAEKDGTDVLGLIAEQDILIPYDSPEDLEINAALLSQNGAAKRYYYQGPDDKKDNLLIYGSVITYEAWTWNWENANSTVISGYVSTTLTYDANLTYGPPPGFPVGSEYNLISWEVIK